MSAFMRTRDEAVFRAVQYLAGRLIYDRSGATLTCRLAIVVRGPSECHLHSCDDVPPDAEILDIVVRQSDFHEDWQDKHHAGIGP